MHAPNLALVMEEDKGDAFVQGQLSVALGAGRIERYAIKLVYQGLNPFVTPTTYDAGNHFEHIVDRHIYPDGEFCLWLPATEPHDFDHPDGLARHLERVGEFIVLQAHYDDRAARRLTPAWVGPQWSHGAEGWREWTREHVQRLPPEQLRSFRTALSSPDTRQRPCPCGSRRRLSACHQAWFAALRRAHRLHPAVWQTLYIMTEGEAAYEALLAQHASRPARGAAHHQATAPTADTTADEPDDKRDGDAEHSDRSS